MLIIRPEQIEAFETARLLRFADTAVAHLRTTRPAYFEAAGEAAVRDSVRHALTRARLHGLRRARDLLRYINVCCILGFGFDEDPRCAWAQAILGDAAADPGARIAEVAAAADAMLRREGR